MNEIIKQYTQYKVPHFFVYAKDKREEQVEPYNKCVVNLLDTIIENKRFSFKLSEFGKIDYKLMTKNPNIEIDDELFQAYSKLNQTYHYKVNNDKKDVQNNIHVKDLIKESLSEFGYSDNEI